MGERLRDIGLALIDPTRSQPLILAEAKVEIGEVDEAQSCFTPEGPAKRRKKALTVCADVIWVCSTW